MPNGKSGQRLDSWKDIAAYLGRDVRTVIRWEKEKGLPVHRVPGGRRQSVFSYPDELDGWLDSGHRTQEITVEPDSVNQASCGAPTHPEHLIVRSSSAKRTALLAVLTVGIAAVAFGSIWFIPRTRDPRLRVEEFKQLTDDGRDKAGLLTDGSQLYFSESINGREVLAAMPIDGGPVRTLSTPFVNARPVDISSDGSRLFVFAYRGYEELRELWIVPLRGGSPRRVGNILCQSAASSPAGDEIVYAVGKDLFITTDDGTSSKAILSQGSPLLHLRWSRDGNHLRFIERDLKTGSYSTWEVDVNGYQPTSQPRMLAKGLLWAEWSNSDHNDQYFLIGFNSHSTLHIARWGDGMEGNDRSIQLPVPDDLSYNPTGIASDPARSRIFLLSKNPRLSDLFRLRGSSGAMMPFLPGLHGEYLDFSRDGRWLTYVDTKDGTLWTSNSDGKNVRLLDAGSQFVQLPRFSPDGSTIAYMSKRIGRPWRIFLIPREGGTPQEASHGNDNQGAPTWAPDGKALVYGEVECQQTRSCAVYRIDLSNGSVDPISDSEGLGTARWSPDGKFIAALRSTVHELWLYDLRTGQWRELSDQVTGNDLSWSHDSKFLYAVGQRNDGPVILRISAEDGSVTLAADLGALSSLSGELSPWFCLAQDDSVIVLRRTNTAEIYQVSWAEE